MTDLPENTQEISEKPTDEPQSHQEQNDDPNVKSSATSDSNPATESPAADKPTPKETATAKEAEPANGAGDHSGLSAETRDMLNASGLKHKEEGNKHMANKEWGRAVESYSKAIQCDPDNYIYYSNRCASYAKLGDHNKALEDATKCNTLAPQWPKGYLRLGHCLMELNDLTKAQETVEKGLQIVEESAASASTKQQKSGLSNLLSEIKGRIRADKNKIFFEKLKGQWHGQMPPELGGYQQEIEFLNLTAARVSIMDRVVTSAMTMDATKSPVTLDLTINLPPEAQQAGGPKTESVFYIVDVVDKELWLCSPHPSTPTTRPSAFEGLTFVKMQSGGIPDLSSELKDEISKLSNEDKILGYVKEACDIFPGDNRLMPLQTDSPERQQEISILNVRFQADNFNITKKYGREVEEKVRDYLVGFKTTENLEVNNWVKQLKSKMQTAMLLPPDEEMKSFQERQKDYEGGIPEKPKVSFAEPKVETTKKQSEEKPETAADEAQDETVSFKKRDLLLVAGLGLGVAAVGIVAVLLSRPSR